MTKHRKKGRHEARRSNNQTLASLGCPAGGNASLADRQYPARLHARFRRNRTKANGTEGAMKKKIKEALMFSGPLFYIVTGAAVFGGIAYSIWMLFQ